MLGTSQGMQSRGRCWLILWSNSCQLSDMHTRFAMCGHNGELPHSFSNYLGTIHSLCFKNKIRPTGLTG